MDAQDTRSLPDLVSAVTGDLANLVRKESELARTEIGEKISEVSKAGVMLAIGAALLLGGFLTLLQALVLALADAIGPVGASVLVGAVASIVGMLVVRAAAAKAKPANLTPDRANRQLHKDAQLVKDQVK